MSYSRLWVDKYVPTNSDELIGNIDNIKLIQKWLKYFYDKKDFKGFKNGLLISGLQGVGKSTAVKILLKECNYDIMEFYSDNIRSQKTISESLKSIVNNSNILSMVNITNKIGVVMDELDNNITGEKSIVKELVSYIEQDIYYSAKNKKKKLTTEHVNNNPVICICNTINSSLKPLLHVCIHVKFDSPSDSDIFSLIKKICVNENINMNDDIINIVIGHCQNDIRRTIFILENIKSYFKNDLIDITKIIEVINTFTQKDLDISLYGAVHSLNTEQLDMVSVLDYYNIDKVFVPLLIHQNIPKNMKYNVKDTFQNKLDNLYEYYSNLNDSILLESAVYENNYWDLLDYSGVLSCACSNNILAHSNDNKCIEYKDIISSPVFSKINYKFYNLKIMNDISKRLKMSQNNFQDYTFIIYKYFILDPKPNIKNYSKFIKYIKSCGLSFTDFDKSIKLSYLYNEYKATYTNKKKKIKKSI